MNKLARWIAISCLGVLGLEASLLANESSEPCEECAAPMAVAPALPDYGVCWHERPKLTGDWFGTRASMLEHGMVWDIDQTNFFFSVANGGRDQRSTYSGHGDFLLNWDLGKAGVQEGLFLKLRAEHHYGEPISNYAGTILPATVASILPAVASEDICLTDVLFTQALSENFAVFAGKLDTLDGDMNAFAHKRGKDQFSNLSFVVNPLLLRTVPYSTLGGGFAILRDLQPIASFMVLNPVNSSSTTGFDNFFEEGATLAGETRLPYEIAELPGQQTFGGAWSSRNYVSMGQDPRVILPDVPIARTSGSWALYWNTDQYLAMYDGAPGKGWGVFGRASVADDQANPLASFVSAGIGGDSPICCRHQDTFGIGYYYLATSNLLDASLAPVLGPVSDGHGVELFYNYEVKRWFHLTTDVQILQPEIESLDTALLLGLRGKIDF